MDTLSRYKELREKTVPGLLLERMKRNPHDVAYRAKKFGIYRERTWMDFGQLVETCAWGLTAVGLKQGERLALMGDPCEEYVICELAAQALGAVTYGIYPTSSQKELRFLMKDGAACIFVAENQEYVDRILPLFNELTHLSRIIIIDTRGIFMYNHPSLMAYEDLMQHGEKKHTGNSETFEQKVRRIKASDNLCIVYTAGTTGNPKGIVISHGKHLAAAYTLVDRYPIFAETPHRTVVFLPLCHVLGNEVAVILPLLTRIVPHFGEGLENLGQTIFETAPTVLFTAPRYLQKFLSSILIGIENTSPIKKLFYRLAVNVGRLHLKKVWEGQKTFLSSLLYAICYQLIFRPILNKIGFDKLKICLSAGAPLPSEVMAWWQVYGLNLSECYGQTEAGGAVISAQGSSFSRPGDVGIPPQGWEVKLSKRGEVLVRGNDICEGYLNDPDLTKEVIDKDGWLHTGDVGEWTAEGNLRIIDRARDMIVTSSGKTLSPACIENNLRCSPYISEAMVCGHNRNYVSVLIEIDPESVSDWARLNNISYTGFTSLAQHPEIIKLVGLEIGRANQDMASGERVKAFRIIPKILDPGEEGEPVTPTRQVKRQLMHKKFKDLVESMYSDKKKRMVASEKKR